MRRTIIPILEKSRSLRLSIVILLLALSNVPAATLYVSQGSTNPTPPYATWAGAALNIQDAVDAAAAGDEVLVTNGVYPGGVTVTNPLNLLSVNGPQLTIIDGGGSNQCISLTDGSSLTGFTLTNGNAFDANGGGVSCSSTNTFLTNCVIAGNSTINNGGGVYGGTLYNCKLTGNTAFYGGGAYGSLLFGCTLSNNDVRGINNIFGPPAAESGGGGAYDCTIENCILTGNTAAPGFGGGASSSTLYNCTLAGNSADMGLGADSCTLYNCALNGNVAASGNGTAIAAASQSTLYNCTLTANSSGGASNCMFYNCIVYFNSVGHGANYDSSCTLNSCCTTLLPANGVGNIDLDPQLASAICLSSNSPCRGAGNAAYATGADIDGELWNNPPSIGCHEYHPEDATGPLTVSFLANYTNVAMGYPVCLTALIDGQTTECAWDFGDGNVAVNEPYAAHSWTQPGNYLVTLRAYNESNPDGVSSTATIHVADSLLYCSAAGTNPQPPYLSWATAATNIQDAVAAAPAGARIIVTNGSYAGGITVNAPLMLTSINGPAVTVIDGAGVVTCVSLTDRASLTGFTLINGYGGSGGLSCNTTNAYVTNCIIEQCTGNNGGGAYQGTLYNCSLTGNSAMCGCGAWGSTLYNCTLTANVFDVEFFPAFDRPSGGGADNCILFNCTLSGNSTFSGGGGAAGCILYNCKLTSNSVYMYGGGAGLNEWGQPSFLYNCTLTSNSTSEYGGGADYCTLDNCIVYSNTNSHGTIDNYSLCTLNYCCTLPLPTNGIGNITNDPLFLSYASGNLRLQSNSPCINAGNNAFVSTGADLDGNRRIIGGAVDMGAYEYQTPVSMISYAWLDQYGLPISTNTDSADLDGTGMTVYQDWIAGLNPTNLASVLVMLPPTVTNLFTGVTVSWQSVAGVNYFLNFTTNLASSFTTIATNIAGQLGTTSYTDTNAIGPGPFFYRAGVSGP